MKKICKRETKYQDIKVIPKIFSQQNNHLYQINGFTNLFSMTLKYLLKIITFIKIGEVIPIISCGI